MVDHNRTFIHPKAEIGSKVTIGPFSTIYENVRIGANTEIGPNVVIYPGVTIGENCKIFPGAIIGAIPQDLKYNGEETTVVIGDNVMIREYCTINKGTKASGSTQVGSNVLLMAYVHIAHDCVIGDHTILANSVNLAGHVDIGEHVILGGIVAVHQFVRIGDHALVGGGSLIRKDVPPFVKAAREPLSYVGVNRVGLLRRGYTSYDVKNIQDIYRIMYVKGWPLSKAIDHIQDNIKDSKFKVEILEFIAQSNRGLMRGFRSLGR